MMKRESSVVNSLSIIIVLYVVLIIGFYVWKFGGDDFSHVPSDWGVFGDFFGGVINPAFSGVTLFFLARTYLLQKEEIRKGEESSQKQRYLAYATTRMQYLNAKISTRLEVMTHIRHELELVSDSVTPYVPGSAYNFWTVDGKELTSQSEKIRYRAELSVEMNAEKDKISELEEEMDTLIKNVSQP